MPYVALDDKFPDNPKVAGLSHAAFRLHVVALCYCSAHLTDGIVPKSAQIHRKIGTTSKLNAQLIEAGLWEIVEDGWRIHDYLDWNASAAQIKEKQRRDRERKRSRSLGDFRAESERNDDEFRADSSGSTPPLGEPSKEGSPSRELAKSARAKKPKTSDYQRAENMTRNAGWQYEPVDFLAELEKFDLDPGQRHDLEQLRLSLANGASSEDDW